MSDINVNCTFSAWHGRAIVYIMFINITRLFYNLYLLCFNIYTFISCCDITNKNGHLLLSNIDNSCLTFRYSKWRYILVNPDT